MDNDSPPHNPFFSRDTQRAPSFASTTQGPGGDHGIVIDAQDVTLGSQFTLVAGMPHRVSDGSLIFQDSNYLSGYNDHSFSHGDMEHTQLSLLPFLDFPWHPSLPQTQPDQFSQIQRGGSATSSLSHCASTEPTQTELEFAPITEEKRRRNTVASARFRIRKKQRTLNLQRTVSDLTGRAEDLEREAADLRRENGWLKEIVMLRGSRLAGANLASRIMAESAQRGAEQNSSKKGENDFSDGDSSSDAEGVLTAESCK